MERNGGTRVSYENQKQIMQTGKTGANKIVPDQAAPLGGQAGGKQRLEHWSGGTLTT